MITLLDYGAGNVRSVINAIEKLGERVHVAASADDLVHAEKLVFPGVGNFGSMMSMLKRKKYVTPLKTFLAGGRPFLGICLGMQVAVIEAARHLAGLDGAMSTEFDPQTPHPVIALITEWQDASGTTEERSESSDMGGTMRLGGQEVTLIEGSLAARAYGKTKIVERHRHRYEFNNNYRDRLSEAGLSFSGVSVDDLVEMIEIGDHPFFLASQFHPEFTSNPRDGHPLFKTFISAVRKHMEDELPEAREA